MGRRRWRERRAPRNPLAASFDFDPWRPHEPDPQPPEPEPSPRLVEHNTRVLEVFKAVGIRGADVAAPRLLCGADLSDGLTCRRVAGHSPDWAHSSTPGWRGLGVRAAAIGARQVAAAATAEQERVETERALNAGTSQMGGLTPDFVFLDEALQYQTEDDRVIAEGLDQVIQADLKKAMRDGAPPSYFEWSPADDWGPFGQPGRAACDEATEQKLDEAAARLEALPAVSNPAPGLWEIVTGKPLPPYRDLVVQHSARQGGKVTTYEALKAAAADREEIGPEVARLRLAAAIERPALAARIVEVLPASLAAQLALAVEESIRRGIRAHIDRERAQLAEMADAASQRLQQSIEDQKRGREANAERWTTPSRLS